MLCWRWILLRYFQQPISRNDIRGENMFVLGRQSSDPLYSMFPTRFFETTLGKFCIACDALSTVFFNARCAMRWEIPDFCRQIQSKSSNQGRLIFLCMKITVQCFQGLAGSVKMLVVWILHNFQRSVVGFKNSKNRCASKVRMHTCIKSIICFRRNTDSHLFALLHRP